MAGYGKQSFNVFQPLKTEIYPNYIQLVEDPSGRAV
jgi:hypothetical protein